VAITSLTARDYWKQHYGDELIEGWGTDILIERLRQLPSVDYWIDLGSGSETLFWACALPPADHITAIDNDPIRLALLLELAATESPRGAYHDVLRRAGRTGDDWAWIRAQLNTVSVADCLSGETPSVVHRAPLVTQFGLLGLTNDIRHFGESYSALSRLCEPGGLFVGANWVASDLTGRACLDEATLTKTIRQCGGQLLELEHIDSADPAYPGIWYHVTRL